MKSLGERYIRHILFLIVAFQRPQPYQKRSSWMTSSPAPLHLTPNRQHESRAPEPLLTTELTSKNATCQTPSYRVYIAFTSAEDTEAVASGGLKAMSHIGEKPRNLSLCKLYTESGIAAKYTNPNSYLHNSVFKSIFFLLLKKKAKNLWICFFLTIF